MYAQPSDGQLVTKLQSGDLDALGDLYQRHKTLVYRTALAITHDPSAAEDILQDCFMRLHRYAYSIDDARPLQPWLYRVTTNLAYDSEKRSKRWQISLDGVMHWLASPPHHSPEWRVETDDWQSEMMNAVSSLNIKHRIVIVLFYLNSLTVQEIASVLECPVGTVKSRLHYGRETLRRKLTARHKVASGMAFEFV